MALNSYILSCALIVWNTFGFRSLGILGCEGENNHGCDKRHHVVNVLGQSRWERTVESAMFARERNTAKNTAAPAMWNGFH